MDPQALIRAFLADSATVAERREHANNYATWLLSGGFAAEVVTYSRQTRNATLLGKVTALAARSGNLRVRTYAADGSRWCGWRAQRDVADVPKESTDGSTFAVRVVDKGGAWHTDGRNANVCTNVVQANAFADRMHATGRYDTVEVWRDPAGVLVRRIGKGPDA